MPEGASRLDLVMTWDEPPADTIASTVLNDLDLWLDRDGDCGEGACGEQVSASRVDNVEWIILRNPQPGTYRAKVVARRVYTAPPRAALAWTVIRGASTPNLRVETDRTLLVGEGEQELTVTVTADQLRGGREPAAPGLPGRRRGFRMRADPNPLHGGVARGWSFGGSVGRCGSADPSRIIDPSWRDRYGRNPGGQIRDFVPRGSRIRFACTSRPAPGTRKGRLSR